MKNKKLEKLLVKIATSAAFAGVLGFIYKAGRDVDERIDKKYEREHGVKPNSLI